MIWIAHKTAKQAVSAQILTGTEWLNLKMIWNEHKRETIGKGKDIEHTPCDTEGRLQILSRGVSDRTFTVAN